MYPRETETESKYNRYTVVKPNQQRDKILNNTTFFHVKESNVYVQILANNALWAHQASVHGGLPMRYLLRFFKIEANKLVYIMYHDSAESCQRKETDVQAIPAIQM